MAIKPNPGSDAAIAAGCKCPVLDNARGKGAYGGNVKGDNGEVLFWMNESCPVHGKGNDKCR